MSEHQSAETSHPQFLGTFTLPDAMDRLVLIGAENTARAENMLTARKEARENFRGIDQSKSKDSFTGSATVFENPDGSLYAMVYTDWVGTDGESSAEDTCWGIKVPITREQLQTMRDAKKARDQENNPPKT